jgi:ABC-type multidrug transport system ATPase subunit
MRVQGSSVFEVSGLSFGFKPRLLFSGLNWAVPAGVSFIQGGEGAGKTTLLRLLAGELSPESGSISIGDLQLLNDASTYRQNVFRTDPRSETFDALTSAEFFAYWADLHKRFNTPMATELAVHLGLEDHLAKPLYMLSTGSKRKMWLAAAFACGATVTLLDEPFAALDHRSIQRVLDLLLEAAQHSQRSWVIADYTPPEAVPLASVINLGD